MDHIEWQVSPSVFVYDFFNHRIRIVTPTALLIAKRPQRWQRHVTGEVGIVAENLFNGRPAEEIVVHLAAFGAKPNTLLRALAEVKVAAVAIVEEDSVSPAALQTDIKRDGLVDRVSSFDITRSIGIPIHERASTLIEPRGFFPKPIE